MHSRWTTIGASCLLLVCAACSETLIETVLFETCTGPSCEDGGNTIIGWPPHGNETDVTVAEQKGPDSVEPPPDSDGIGSGTPEPEECNGKDDDQDGEVDEEDAKGCKLFYIDADKDGFGGGSYACLCAPGAPYTAVVGGDCDDTNATVRPGGQETCYNLVDDDCDGEINQKNCDSKECGDDGCGGSCGNCPEGKNCNGYGHCVAPSVVCYASCHCPSGYLCDSDNTCKSKNVMGAPYPYPPCCNDAVACSPPGSTCRTLEGTDSLCAGGMCAPTSCEAQGKDCGNVLDGCGLVQNCGSCDGGYVCGAAVPNECGMGSCLGTTCGSENANCGLLADGCGGVLYCGDCNPGQPCGGGLPNVCGGAQACEEDPDAIPIVNGEMYFYSFAPGESRYFYFSEKSNKGSGNNSPLHVDIVDMTPEGQHNIDVLVKYVGFGCEFAKPTLADYDAVIAGDVSFGDNGLFFSVGGSAFEMVEIPTNPEGFFYIMVLNVDTEPEQKMRIGYSDADSYE